MEFDDRLRKHMHEHGEKMVVRSEGAVAVAERSRRRHQRRTVATAAAAAVIVVGIGAFILSTANSGPRQITTATADGVAAATSTTAPAVDLDAQTQADLIYGPSAALIETAERIYPEPGDPLRFSNVDLTDAPAGYNLSSKSSSGDFYYVLSPEFRSTDERIGEFDQPDVNTLYAFDGTRWTQNSFGDRSVNDIDSLPGGSLYAVSTGTAGDRKLEIGESTDAGATWTWDEIDLANQFGADPARWPDFQVQMAGDVEQRLVVVSKAAEVDWDEAVRLAQKAGLDIDLETDEIFQIDSTGISASPNLFQGGGCAVPPASPAAERECADTLFGEVSEPGPDDVLTATWEELGINIPTSWLGNTVAYLVEQGGVTELGEVFGDTGFMIDISYSEGEYNVIFDNTLYSTPVVMQLTTLVSSNAIDWTASEAPLGVMWPSVELGDSTFVMTWVFDSDDGDSTVLLRSTDDRVEKLFVSDLLGDIDADQYELNGIDVGSFGLIAWMSGGFDENGATGSVILYSPDGVEWSATELPDAFVIDAIIGDDGVMVFVDDPFASNEQSPPPILLGTL